jgi:hypothetical protein
METKAIIKGVRLKNALYLLYVREGRFVAGQISRANAWGKDTLNLICADCNLPMTSGLKEEED